MWKIHKHRSTDSWRLLAAVGSDIKEDTKYRYWYMRSYLLHFPISHRSQRPCLCHLAIELESVATKRKVTIHEKIMETDACSWSMKSVGNSLQLDVDEICVWRTFLWERSESSCLTRRARVSFWGIAFSVCRFLSAEVAVPKSHLPFPMLFSPRVRPSSSFSVSSFSWHRSSHYVYHSNAQELRVCRCLSVYL